MTYLLPQTVRSAATAAFTAGSELSLRGGCAPQSMQRPRSAGTGVNRSNPHALFAQPQGASQVVMTQLQKQPKKQPEACANSIDTRGCRAP